MTDLGSTDLAQKEELISTLLGVFITGPLHLLQMDSLKLELLFEEGGSDSRREMGRGRETYAITSLNTQATF